MKTSMQLKAKARYLSAQTNIPPHIIQRNYFLVCIIMLFVLSACNNAANGEDEMPIVVPDPPADEPATQPEQNDPQADESDDPPDDPSEETKWGPLTADFIALLTGKNYYIKLEVADVFTGDAESDIEIPPIPSDWAIRWHRVETARQGDLCAWTRWFSTDKSNEPSQHTINKDDKKYGINHMFESINVWELPASSADDSSDFFPVSSMYFIESGMGSINGVTMPYENYTRTDTTGWRFYVNGDKVEYCMRTMSDGSVMDLFSLMEISQDVPSRMFEMPENYTFEEIG